MRPLLRSRFSQIHSVKFGICIRSEGNSAVLRESNAAHRSEEEEKEEREGFNRDVGSPLKLRQGLQVLGSMDHEGIMGDSKFYTGLLQTCAKTRAITQGMYLHSHAMQTGVIHDMYVSNSLINMYVKCGNLESAGNVFDKMPTRDVISWTAMISGYAQNLQGDEALGLLCQMHKEGTEPNHFTFAIAVRACAGLAALEKGKQVHNCVVIAGHEHDVFVRNSLVYMYAQCGSIEDARQVFDKMPARNVYAWNAMIGGYAQHGFLEEALRLLELMPKPDEITWSCVISGCAQNWQFDEALELFVKMQKTGIRPNYCTFGSVVKACADCPTVEQGKQVHAHVVMRGCELDIVVGNALVGMYGKCGNVEDASRVFDQMPVKNVVTWSTMIVGCAQHGQGKEALKLFEQMLAAGLKPNEVTFVGVLYACSHAGLVDEGRLYFDSMRVDHGIIPTEEHYTCMVDILGRAGYLDEAEHLINEMPIKSSESTLGALIGACRIYGNADMAKRAERHVLELDIQNAGLYAILANIYASAGRWDDVANVRKMMRDRGLKKEPGLSWIEVNNRTHSFVAGDTWHPQKEEIYAMLEKMFAQMRIAGYIPDTNLVLQNVEQKEKEHALVHHSEKLAIAFGLISTPSRTTIHVVKNLRVCSDCHTAIKFISKIYERDIVVRDNNRFHHFKGGLCSCGDFW